MPDGMTRPAPLQPTITVRLLRPLGRLWLKASGWHIEGEMPNLPKFIIVAAGHTSNWDLPYVLAAALHYGIRVHWRGLSGGTDTELH